MRRQVMGRYVAMTATEAGCAWKVYAGNNGVGKTPAAAREQARAELRRAGVEMEAAADDLRQVVRAVEGRT